MKLKSYIRQLLSYAIVVLTLFTVCACGNNPHITINKIQQTAPTNQYAQTQTVDDNVIQELGPAEIDSSIQPGQIVYDKFDSLGRTLGVKANLDHTNYEYGQREREDISGIKPSGWVKNQKVTINFADGSHYSGYFYNRSHLLAHSLGGDDADYNMITGTRQQNVGKNDGNGGMAYTETLARDYLKKNPNGTLYYSVEPEYTGDELVPRSVIVNIKSNDGSIDKQVRVYNVATGYTIDYMTGEYQKK